MGLAKRIGQQESPAVSLAQALTPEGIFFWFVVGGLIAPLIEELIFRGLLYRAWEAQWGWGWSMLATSALFAAYHPVPFAAFISAIIFVAVYRRTGSIWAPIMVHGIGNMMTSPIFMGSVYFRTAGKETGEIALWWLHLGALGVVLVIVPIYVWMARTRP
jgi:membrane protease YdiL (CAAX protease family)